MFFFIPILQFLRFIFVFVWIIWFLWVVYSVHWQNVFVFNGYANFDLLEFQLFKSSNIIFFGGDRMVIYGITTLIGFTKKIFWLKFVQWLKFWKVYLNVKKFDTGKRNSDKRWSEILANILGRLVKVSYYKC